MIPLSTKQLMQKSVAFKVSFSFAIILAIAVGVLAIVSPTVTCRFYQTYQSCNAASSYYHNQCTNGLIYCCNSKSKYCGDNYCQSLDSFSYYTLYVCWGILIAMWFCSFACFILTILTIFLFCYLRRKAIKQNMIYNDLNSSGQLGYVPPTAFPRQDQPVAFPQQSQPVPIQLNRTEITQLIQ